MRRYRAPAGLAAVIMAVALVALPALARAKHSQTAPKPAVGTWTMKDGNGYQPLSASFTVDAGDTSVSNIQIIAPDLGATCSEEGGGAPPSTVITIAGPEPMHIVNGGPHNKPEYIVGYSDKPTVIGPTGGFKGLTVSMTEDGGQAFQGQLALAFRSAKDPGHRSRSQLGSSTSDFGVFYIVFTNPALLEPGEHLPAKEEACPIELDALIPPKA